ncbi:MAG TPA: DNA polymerase IV [Candidatus Krumholzibacterium sp.]|nr:DNA polymerase IV [Candidatus Krumholzibacterium sp.]
MKERNRYPAGPGLWKPGEAVIAHIDMDAFYASVEILDFPELAGKPVVVGGSSNRGVVSAASYRARDFGIHSAMPIFQAKKLCPDLVIRPGRMTRYSEISAVVMKLLHSFSPLVEQISIDEAYIDLTGTEKLFGPAPDTAERIRAAIREQTSLTCSVGLSTSKLVAKIASDLDKPDGLTIIPPERVRGFLESLPVGKIPGIGKKSGEELRKLGIMKVGDILRFSPRFLREKFGRFGERILDIAEGRTGGQVVPWSRPKSVSNELTLEEDTDDIGLLEQYLLGLSEQVGRRLRKHDLKGRTVTLKLKDSDHRLITRSHTLEKPTSQGKRIFTTVRELLHENGVDSAQRLVGVGVSNFEEDSGKGQFLLFEAGDDDERKWDRVDRAMDSIVDRYGRGAVNKGKLGD